ncbi:MAG: glycosyltransferase [Paludibacteraceae bacterium]|nr:glycosyltransferase [Paludibacteraceae bacterium]
MQLLVVSSYPEKSVIHGEKTVGVANYTKATLLALENAMLDETNSDLQIKVFAEQLDKPEIYTENTITVERFWKRGSAKSIINLFIRTMRDPANTILLPIEMYMFGSFLHLLIAFPFLLLFKIKRKRVILVLHQVLGGNISTFEKNKLKVFVYSAMRSVFYKSLIALTSVAIVFEDEFKHRLGNSKKVSVIPHAVIKEDILDKDTCKQKLGLDANTKYLFYFGYLSPYKGIEELLTIWEPYNGVQLIIGGGGNPNHMNKPEYKAFVDGIMQQAKEKNVLTTGFIPQEQMSLYFSAVDIVILPYTVFMSSSGPLSHAFSYNKGVLLSSNLKGYFNSEDMQNALEQTGLSVDDLCFDLNKPIKNKVEWALQNQDKLEQFSKTMFQLRNWDVLGKEYNRVIMDKAI